MSSDLSANHRKRFFEKLEVFYEFADRLSDLSCCKRMKVGAIILPADFSEVLAIGYNGPPAGASNDACTELDPCGCIHAEANAIIKLDSRGLSNLVMLCTHPPCWRCAGAIINKRSISRVLVWRDHEKCDGVMSLLQRGIQVLDRASLLRHPQPRAWWAHGAGA